MVKKNLFRYSSVLMCVVLTAASLVGCGANTAATTNRYSLCNRDGSRQYRGYDYRQ
ncbi:MAG: hypothetical protein ACLS9K_09210 [Lachnospira eligens]